MVDLLDMVPEDEKAEEGSRGWRVELRGADVCDEFPSSLYMVQMGWAQSWKVGEFADWEGLGFTNSEVTPST